MSASGVAGTTLLPDVLQGYWCSSHRPLCTLGLELCSLLGSGPSLFPTPIGHAATKTPGTGLSFSVSRPTLFF